MKRVSIKEFLVWIIVFVSLAGVIIKAEEKFLCMNQKFEDKYHLLKDIKYFPVAKSTNSDTGYVYYTNSWGDKRTYGGERIHEGIDIMAEENVRGKCPVVSMTDGKVEHIGWLELGGYRIGIRSKHGGYFYYAHLFSYAEGMEEGKDIKAGQLIGYMGDSGYGKEEGTVGMFAVHLHLGIYINDKDGNEQSINPYYYLKAAEESVIKYRY